jgi:hypothetical protein
MVGVRVAVVVLVAVAEDDDVLEEVAVEMAVPVEAPVTVPVAVEERVAEEVAVAVCVAVAVPVAVDVRVEVVDALALAARKRRGVNNRCMWSKRQGSHQGSQCVYPHPNVNDLSCTS